MAANTERKTLLTKSKGGKLIPQKSAYRLYVEWHQVYYCSEKTRNNFYSDDHRTGLDKSLESLLKVIMKRKGKYERARLYDNQTNKLLRVWIRGEEIPVSEFLQEYYGKPLFKAWIRLQSQYQLLQKKVTGRDSIIISSVDVNKDGEKGKDIAIKNLRDTVTQPLLKNKIILCYVYDQETNKKVVSMNPNGYSTFFDKNLEFLCRTSKFYNPSDFGLF